MGEEVLPTDDSDEAVEGKTEEYSNSFSEFAHKADGTTAAAEDEAEELRTKDVDEGDEEPELAPAADPESAEPEAKSDPEPDPEPTPEDDGEKDVDEYEGMSDSVKRKFEGLKADKAKLEQKIRSDKGRYDARERDDAKLRKELAASKEEAAKLSDGKKAKDDTEPDDLEELRKDYPEVYEPIKKALKSKDDKLDALAGKFDEQETKDHLAKENTLLLEKNPHFYDSVRHEGFDDWLNKQPKVMRDIVAKNEQGIVDHEDAGFVIDKFESDLGISYDADNASEQGGDKPSKDKLAGKRSLQAEGAKAPTVNSKGSAGDGPPDEFKSAFKHFADKKEKANATR